MGAHPPSSALIVLGMHRSGTSTVTGTLGLCGAWVGEREELTGEGHENPKGFFERRDLRNICDSLLFAADADWWKVSAFRAERIPDEVLEDRRAALVALVRSLGEHGTWIIKEPRLCLLFPLLRPVIPDAVCIHSVRNPLEVAHSLRARNGFSIMQGLALWEAYTRASLAASAGVPRTVVSYEALLAAPVEQTSRLVRHLQALGVRGLRMPETAIVEDFIVPELRRERSDDPESMALLEPPQRELWERIAAGEELSTAGLGALSPRSLQHLRDLEAQHASFLALKQEREALGAAQKKLKASYANERKAHAEERKAYANERKAAATALIEARDRIKALEAQNSSWLLKRLRR